MEEEDSAEASVLGICLTSETYTSQFSGQDTVLGSILVDLLTIKSVQDLRGTLQEQLDTLPEVYRFLTKQRWPLKLDQEEKFSVKHVIDSEGIIRIQSHHGQRKVGIVSGAGKALGFVFFSDLNLKVSHLRKAINFQLTEVKEFWNNSWVFLDNNSWPLSSKQEEAIAVLEVLCNSSVRVQFGAEGGITERVEEHTTPTKDSSLSPPAKIQRVQSPSSISSGEDVQCYTQPHTMAPMHSITEADSPIKTNSQPAKQILISYVRAEASEYALDLKAELENRNISVYLDVHEIFGGTDWQDSLNYAVSNCEVFVPLVTPRYGETQWTNREIKLADVLNKYIVPISFLKYWPPRCLAIQFATTQFINWKLASCSKYSAHGSHAVNGIDSADGGFSWDRPDVVAVSKEIVRRCKREAKKNEKNASGKPNQLNRLSRGFSTMFPLKAMDHIDGVRDRPSLVIISAHPAQEAFAEELKELFESENLQVWTTLELIKVEENGEVHSDDTDIIPDSQQDNIGSSSQYNREVIFQQKVEEAGVIVFVLSKSFAESGTCKQQVYYCEQRKQVVPLKFEAFEMPGWMSLLIGTNTFEDVQRTDYRTTLLNRVSRAVSSDTVEDTAEFAKEVEINASVQFICQKLPSAGCVYIAGGTKFFYEKSADICKCIGESLAELSNLSVVTGGFYGVGETISFSFYESRKNQGKETNVWHILPVRDEQDRSAQGRQNSDKTFQKVPFGQTIYCGESVRQRETIVSRVFDICILVEGGPGAAHEAEEFTWSDHTVIPVKCTGGAAGGKFKVPEKIFEVPPGVDALDWHCLGKRESTPEEIGKAVKSIVIALSKGAASQVTCQKSFYKRPAISRTRSLSSS